MTSMYICQRLLLHPKLFYFTKKNLHYQSNTQHCGSRILCVVILIEAFWNAVSVSGTIPVKLGGFLGDARNLSFGAENCISDMLHKIYTRVAYSI